MAALVVAHVPPEARRSDAAPKLSMYSRTCRCLMAFSLSNRYSASAFASSVLPARGPREQNEPMGRFRVGQPGAVAADGAGHRGHGLVLAHHALVQLCPPGRPAAISPCIIFCTGMPVHVETTSAISSSSDCSSLRMAPSCCHVQLFLGRMQLLLAREYARSGSQAFRRSPSRVARSSSSCARLESDLRFCTCSMASFSFCHSALRLSRSS